MSKNNMSYDEWIAYGQENNWCSKMVCYTHEYPPMSESEDLQFSDDLDPCIFVVRIYENDKQSAEVRESSHNG